LLRLIRAAAGRAVRNDAGAMGAGRGEDTVITRQVVSSSAVMEPLGFRHIGARQFSA
jgi:hypothetical protein